jgi:hypothetical protein
MGIMVGGVGFVGGVAWLYPYKRASKARTGEQKRERENEREK